MTWWTRQLAIRLHYEANLPVPVDRVDLTSFNGAPFKPPALPALTASMSPAEKLAALQGAIWIRLQRTVYRSSQQPFHLGANAPTESRGSLDQHLFYPRGYGEDFVGPIVVAAQLVFHRQRLDSAGIRFLDAGEPIEVVPADSEKFAHLVVPTEYHVIQKVAA